MDLTTMDKVATAGHDPRFMRSLWPPFALVALAGTFPSHAAAQTHRPVPLPAPGPVSPANAPTGPHLNAPQVDPAAVERAADATCDNWGFEDGLNCWTNASATAANAFTTQPTIDDNVPASRVMAQMEYGRGGIGGDYWKQIPYPVGGVRKNPAPQPGYKSQRWIGTAESHHAAGDPLGRQQGDAPQGEIRSKPFRVRQKYVSFLVGGGRTANVGVALQIPSYLVTRLGLHLQNPAHTTDGWTEVAVAHGNDSEMMNRHVWDVAAILGLNGAALQQGTAIARVAIYDYDSGGWGHVNADDIRFGDAPPTTYPVTENGRIVQRDVDQPVWGFADTHAHPTNHLGFGGKTIGGDPEGPMSQALATNKCTDIHAGVLRVMGGRNHQHFAVGVPDEHLADGYPTFIGWPKFTSQFHQQQHVDWIRRAFDGGERLIVALGVTNMFWATRSLGLGITPTAKIDDESAAIEQLRAMRQIVDHNASWMEVARSPADARRIIGSGKMAIVLGIEADNFGNFKDEHYGWVDGGSYPIPPSARLQALPRDPEQARAVIRAKIAQYFDRELVRQVTPLHYVSGVFGGTAVFRGQFSFINSSMTDGPYLVRNATAAEGVYYNVGRDIDGLQAFLALGGIPARPIVACSDAANRSPSGSPTQDFVCNASSVNALGLTPRGSVLVQELMRAGVLVDMEHASVGSSRQMQEMSTRYGYPLLSSHTDPRELGMAPAHAPGAIFRPADAAANAATFGTTLINNLSHEGALGSDGFGAIRRSGGTVGILTFPFRRRGFPSDEHPVIPNDCQGSTKTWAQSYLYAIDRLGGAGVALATDRGFNDFLAPRFGVYAAYPLHSEGVDDLKIARRGSEKNAQRNGVRYDVPFRFFHPARFEFGDTTLEEEDAWKAVMYWEARQTSPLDARYSSLPEDQKVPQSSHVGHGGRIESFVRGLAATSESQLRDCCGDTPFEEAAMFVLKRGVRPDQLGTLFRRDVFRNNLDKIRAVLRYAQPVYVLWGEMKGTNEPLRKRTDGVHDWDYNIDGLAHYGMLPDFLQDAKNVGLTPAQLRPLFTSAEDYIRMWEHAEAARANVR